MNLPSYLNDTILGRRHPVTWERDGESWVTQLDGYRITRLPDGKATTQRVKWGRLIGKLITWGSVDEALSTLGWERTS